MLLLPLTQSQAQQKEWIGATVFYNDGHSEEGKIFYRNSSYSSFIRFRGENAERPERITPDEVSSISYGSYPEKEFLSISLPSGDYFNEATYFAQLSAGYKVKLVKTRYYHRTCSCNNRGSYRWGWFLVSDNRILLIETYRNRIIRNLDEVNSFLTENGFRIIADDENFIDELQSIIN